MDYIRGSNIIEISGEGRSGLNSRTSCLRTHHGIKTIRSSIIIISKEMSVSLVLSKMSASSVSCGTSFTGESNELRISDWLITIS